MATELEQLEQAITRALQDIDRNITRCNKAVEHGILPALEQYNRGSGKVWDKGGHFWMDFLEKAACVKFTTHDEDVEDAHTVDDPSMTEKVPLKQDSYETEGSMLENLTNMSSVIEVQKEGQNDQQDGNYNLLSELDSSMEVSLSRGTPEGRPRKSATSTPRIDRHASSGKSKIPHPDYSLDKTPDREPLKHALESASKKYDHELARAAKRTNYDTEATSKFNFKPSFVTKSAYAPTASTSKATPASAQPWYMNVDLDDSFDLPSPPKLASMNWETRSVMKQRINDKEYHIDVSPAKPKPQSTLTKSSGAYSPFHPKKMDAASTPAKLFTPQKPPKSSKYQFDNFSDDDSDMMSPPQLTTHVMQWDAQKVTQPPSGTRQRSPEKKGKGRAESPVDFDYKSGHTPFAKTPLALRMDREKLQQRTENLLGSPNKDIFGTQKSASTKYDMLSFNDSGESFQPPDLSPPVTIRFDQPRLQFTPAKEGARRVVEGALREAGGESDESMEF